jgi:hypothetical protein
MGDSGSGPNSSRSSDHGCGGSRTADACAHWNVESAYRHVERVFNPARKDPHWGSQKLAASASKLLPRCTANVAMGHFQTSSRVPAKSVDPSTADMRRLHRHVGFVPILLQKSQRAQRLISRLCCVDRLSRQSRDSRHKYCRSHHQPGRRDHRQARFAVSVCQRLPASGPTGTIQ